MKKKLLLTLLMVSLLAVAGCGKEEEAEGTIAEVTIEDEPIETEVEETVEPEVVEEPEEEYPYLYKVIEEREVVDGKMQSYLTGEWVDEAIATRRPIAVSIPNQKSCLPHYGITNASIIYQVPLRDNLTRLFCMFEDFDDLDRVGPVRSIRDYMVYDALEHNAIVCHWGSAVYANELLNSDLVDNISQGTAGIEVPTGIAFDRYDRPGKNSTDSAYMFIDGLMKGVEKRGYTWDYEEVFEPKFLFAQDDVIADYADAPAATKIWPGEKGNYNTVGAYFEYDETTGLYDYYEYGEKLYDEHSDSTLQVANVILQVCYAEERDDHGYLIMEMHGPITGDGTMYYFTQGKVVEGTWERMNGDEKPTKYYDKDGNEIVLNQGKTFVCQIWHKWADTIKFE